ncbi:hypothetical protein GCM10009593_26800 [Microlunatus antarcticus]|uniref:hypothetical protein n=1 Tax=Microlunatus antarcticus TaxID=53388 RepID=UPI0018E0AEA2|nr:hypothetical protein [Microlunatus antarcticus]
MTANCSELYALKPAERNTPLRTRTAPIRAAAVVGRNDVIAISVAIAPRMLAISTLRKPKRRSSGLVAGSISRFPTNRSRTYEPARTADQPNPTCSTSGRTPDGADDRPVDGAADVRDAE